MQRLEVSGAVRPIYGSLGVKRLTIQHTVCLTPTAKYTLTPYCGLDYIISFPVLTINTAQHMSQGHGFDSQWGHWNLSLT